MKNILIFIVALISLNVFGQDIKEKYTLHDLDNGTSYAISIKQDIINENATIILQNDSIKIFKVLDIRNVKIHSEKFLEIEFRVRGGSGIKVRRSILLCISHNKIHKALDIISEFTVTINQVYDKVADSLKLFDEKEYYHVSLSINSVGEKAYQAVLFEEIDVVSKYNPSQNMSHNDRYKLQFDPSGYFFFNSEKLLNKSYKIYSNKDGRMVTKFLNEEVPCTQLYRNLYLYIDNEWYLDNGDDELTCL
ncbi:MAG TPA: hypothetical protein VIN08_16665 [Ohtaekwangia sp.]|uniref:hypothetical protein n=1 Tax=Ohtaekwangia sp. TaxID=2066019 RepID=UPI002F938E60